VTYQLNTGIPDDLADDLKSYADARGISVAAAVRILLHDALNGKEKP
jgi:plasmid stability protein